MLPLDPGRTASLSLGSGPPEATARATIHKENPTMHITRTCSALMVALTLSLGVIACEKKEGPTEKLGAKIDAAAGDVKAAAEDAKEDVKKAVDEAGKFRVKLRQ